MSEESKRLQLWGGVECTISRVQDEYFDQLKRSGHYARVEDLDRFAELGITALRQPVLWEMVAPESIADADWSWPDKYLQRLRELGIRPIVGLVHHGSGPRHTSLLDPQFGDKLAKYARAVAERYPWVKDFTPVNEPLTTARFSGLYGHWYPHGCDDLTFATTLINECRATVLAMRAIRSIIPDARLVQTDDLGKIFSTPQLSYQAEFENERRWGAWDLLTGRLTPDTLLWKYLVRNGIHTQQLEWFIENKCSPDTIGVNHYLSGERFLDENLDRYPGEPVGGNGKQRYVDVLATRVRLAGASGIRSLLHEAWERYRIPLAITEVHNGCTREEQLRWFVEIYKEAEAARQEGVDVRAITAWSLLGAFDWNSLVTRKDDHYEPGVYDIRSPQPRETAVAKSIRQLSQTGEVQHPVLSTPGWWKRPQRFTYGHAVRDDGMIVWPRKEPSLRVLGPSQPIVIVGAGTLGRALERECILRGLDHVLLTRSEVDITRRESVQSAIRNLRPWAVINAAGYTDVDAAETDAERCFAVNTRGVEILADVCAENEARFVTFSSQLIFDGLKEEPYLESDLPSPLNVFGLSKAEAERRVTGRDATAMVIRIGEPFSPWNKRNFVYETLSKAAAGIPINARADIQTCVSYVPDLVHSVLDLLIDLESGIWHLANAGGCSPLEWAKRIVDYAGFAGVAVEESARKAFGPAERPAYSVLSSERAWLMPNIESALERYFRDSDLHAELRSIASEAA